jgi:drug/metabolite transporter (DMT)-like permease
MAYTSLFRLAALALLWGCNFLWIKLALRGFTPIQITFVRLALGAVVLTMWLYAYGNRLPGNVTLWMHSSVAAIVANVGPYLLFAYAEQQVDASVAGIYMATTPLWTTVLAVLIRQEKRPSRGKITGLLVGAVGTLLIFSPWHTESQFTSRGAAACFLATLGYAVSYVYIDRFLVRRNLSSLALSSSQLLAAMAIAAVLTPMSNGWRAPEWRTDAVIGLMVLGAFGTGLTYVINYRLISDEGGSAASVVVYLLPVVALLVGVVTLREIPAPHALVGMVIVLIGVALTRRATQAKSYI